MTDTIDTVEQEIRSALHSKALLQYLVAEESEFLHLGYYSVHLVLSDATKIDEIVELIFQLQARLKSERQIDFEYSVRAKWTLQHVRTSEELRTADGAVTAASVVSVELRSGAGFTMAHVIVTWEASQTLTLLLKREFSMGEVAKAMCLDMLQRRGSSAWDPLKQATIQINSSAALYVSRLLRKAA